jgi:hypothetical protein
MNMTTTTNTAKMTLTKGNGHYNIAVDGVYAGWTYKNVNGTWSVRIASTEGNVFTNSAEVVKGETTRAWALEDFARWLASNSYFLVLRQEREAKDAAFDAWLAAV